jgi:hypothetical protein
MFALRLNLFVVEIPNGLEIFFYFIFVLNMIPWWNSKQTSFIFFFAFTMMFFSHKLNKYVI